MKKKYVVVLSLVICLIFLVLSCPFTPRSYSPIKQEEMGGDFEKTKSGIITKEYKVIVTNGFHASIDFDISKGEVDWEIIDPKGNIAFAGYVISGNGKTYRQLTKPSSYFNGRFSKKEEVKDGPDYGLQFESDSPSGVYKLKIKPRETEGNYKVVWSDRLGRK
jgi:hypothetical protein